MARRKSERKGTAVAVAVAQRVWLTYNEDETRRDGFFGAGWQGKARQGKQVDRSHPPELNPKPNPHV